jgi:hypothetical protein
MVSTNIKALGGAAAAYFMVQQVQCPPIAIPLITSAALQTAAAVGSAGASFAGAIVAANVGGGGRKARGFLINKRQEFVAPEGVPQFEFDRCYNDLANPDIAVNVQGPVSTNGIQVDGLPATCMNLATVIDGDAAGGPVPTPCGSACLLYDNLSAEDYESMRVVFEELKNA